MGRGAGVAGALLAGACGVFTAYSTLQPALKEEQDKRAGTFTEQHQTENNKGNVISQAILSDLKEAKEEVVRRDGGKFAWGIRQWWAGQGQTASQPPPAQNSEERHVKR